MQDIDEKLVLEFLYAFSRFEYALKRSGYHGQDGRVAQADWDQLENVLSGLPDADLAPVLACGDYVLATPPQETGSDRRRAELGGKCAHGIADKNADHLCPKDSE
jgi:hypothetical protein